ncbi:MAG: hypothetical protein NTV63_01105 [Candidatus Woesearchaeota archaeon]|nr:hypothetical protein [Candidatus Woesearchaeota archaeon]
MEYFQKMKFICELEDGIRGEHMGKRESPRILYERTTTPYYKSTHSIADYARNPSAEFELYLPSDEEIRQRHIDLLGQELSRRIIIDIDLLHPRGSGSDSLDDKI